MTRIHAASMPLSRTAMNAAPSHLSFGLTSLSITFPFAVHGFSSVRYTDDVSAKDAAKSLKRKLVAKTAPATLVKALIVGDWILRMHIPEARTRYLYWV